MHRLLAAFFAATFAITFTQVVSAADMPVKAPVAPIATPYSWTGFYVGGNIGGGWGHHDVTYALNDPLMTAIVPAGIPPASFDTSGVTGGLQLGYNWQFNRSWLVGLEADFNWSGIRGSGSSPAILTVQTNLPFTATTEEDIKWFGTVRARFGYLPTDNLLAYVTGGFAYGKIDHSSNLINNSGTSFSTAVVPFAVTCVAGTACWSGSSNHTATGWTVGGGFEYAIWQRWTIRAEYLYVSLGSQSIIANAVVVGAGLLSSSINANFDRTNFNVARVGVNYRF
jgi:outer membrane immunogenic protein